MEAKRLQQDKDQTEPADTEVAVGQESGGGKAFIVCHTSSYARSTAGERGSRLHLMPCILIKCVTLWSAKVLKRHSSLKVKCVGSVFLFFNLSRSWRCTGVQWQTKQQSQWHQREFSRCCKPQPQGCTCSVASYVFELSTSGLYLPADDPVLWDSTLDGIEELDVPTDSPSSRGLRPSTPGNHQMWTRSKTPKRNPGRPPEKAPSYGRGQDSTHFIPQNQDQYNARPGRN